MKVQLIEHVESHPSALTFQRRYLSRDGDDCAAYLTCGEDDSGAIYARWSVRRRGEWGRAFRKTFATRDDAAAFATHRWEACRAWLFNHPFEAPDERGAIDAFSAQVATILR